VFFFSLESLSIADLSLDTNQLRVRKGGLPPLLALYLNPES